ncbi:MAG: hemolysin family protein [Gammaproteobacteria bacterium]
MTMLVALFPVMIALLLIKGFFSGSEIALVSCDKLKLKTESLRGNRKASLVLKLMKTPETLLTTTLIGTNVSTMTLTVIATATAIQLLGPGGDLVAILLLSPIMLIFGEIVPKSVFQQMAEKISLAVIRPLAFVRLLVYPFVLLFGWTARHLAVRFRPGGGQVVSPYATRQRLRLMLERSDLPDLPGLDRNRLRRAILFSDMTVGEAMIPLAQVVGAPDSISMKELLQLAKKAGHRRIPLYEGNLSNIVAISNWSVWQEFAADFEDSDSSEHTAKAYFVSTMQKLDEILPVLTARKDQMAVAVDEFGTAAGIVTMEDLMALLYGNVAQRFHHGPEETDQPTSDGEDDGGKFFLEGRTRLAEASELLDIDLPSREFHSVAGLLTSRLRRIPVVGDSLEEADYRFTVIEANERTATLIQVEPV